MAFNIQTEVKRAVVRRIVYVLISLALVWIGIGKAHASGGYLCDTNPSVCTREQAYEECAARGELAKPAPSFIWQCVVSGNLYIAQTKNPAIGGWSTVANPNGFRWGTPECPAPKVWDEPTKKCKGLKDCTIEPPITGVFGYRNSPLTVCRDSCLYSVSGESCTATVVDATTWTTCTSMSPTGGNCNDDDPLEDAPTDSDGDGSSDGNDGAPNNPGEGGGGPDGKPNQDGSGGGSNDDGSGSGNGNTSGGGGSCGSPPSSSGDAILGQIAYQTWATRCAVEKGFAESNGSGSGDGGTGNGSGSGSNNGDEINNYPFNKGALPDTDTEDVEDSVHIKSPDFVSMIDTSGFIGGGSCPSFGSITMGPFGTHSLGGEWFCNWLPMIRAIILLFGAYSAIRILLGGNL